MTSLSEGQRVFTGDLHTVRPLETYDTILSRILSHKEPNQMNVGPSFLGVLFGQVIKVYPFTVAEDNRLVLTWRWQIWQHHTMCKNLEALAESTYLDDHCQLQTPGRRHHC